MNDSQDTTSDKDVSTGEGGLVDVLVYDTPTSLPDFLKVNMPGSASGWATAFLAQSKPEPEQTPEPIPEPARKPKRRVRKASGKVPITWNYDEISAIRFELQHAAGRSGINSTHKKACLKYNNYLKQLEGKYANK